MFYTSISKPNFRTNISPPHTLGPVPSTLANIRDGSWRPVAPHVTPELEDLVGRMLRADPSRRLSLASVASHKWMRGPMAEAVVRPEAGAGAGTGAMGVGGGGGSAAAAAGGGGAAAPPQTRPRPENSLERMLASLRMGKGGGGAGAGGAGGGVAGRGGGAGASARTRSPA